MKLKKLVALAMVGVMSLGLVACGGKDSDSSSTSNSNSGDETKKLERPAKPAEKDKPTIALTMWGAEEDQEMLAGMIETFKKEYGDWANFDIQLGVESESKAKDDIIVDVEAAADVYAFASDQINDLVKAGALQALDEDMSVTLETWTGKDVAGLKAANASGSVDAATVNDKLYAFPMSADNGYFLYYDSSVLSEDDVKSWDALLAAADKAGKKVSMTFESGWYNASFFYGAGFTTGLNADGTTAIDWDGKANYTGVEVVQSMLGIAGHSAFLAAADGDITNQIASGQLVAAVSGTWDAQAAQKAFGDGYAATKLPTFTCAGDQVQQGSVAGFKLVGVNPYSKNVGWAALLADWITNEENQKIRFEKREIGPSNINAAASDAVKNNIAIAALSEQSAYGVVQVVGGKFWEPTASFGKNIASGTVKADDTAGIQELIDAMVEGVTAPVE